METRACCHVQTWDLQPVLCSYGKALVAVGPCCRAVVALPPALGMVRGSWDVAVPSCQLVALLRAVLAVMAWATSAPIVTEQHLWALLCPAEWHC